MIVSVEHMTLPAVSLQYFLSTGSTGTDSNSSRIDCTRTDVVFGRFPPETRDASDNEKTVSGTNTRDG